MSSVSIVDYGIGNILSVSRAFEHFGIKVNLINSPEQVEQADRIVLPGVGAFADGMSGLSQLNLVAALKQFVQTGKPFLGICLGMQLMLSKSNEFGEHAGLDIIQGEVVAVPNKGIDGTPHKIPHIGWNELIPSSDENTWSESILKQTPIKSAVYFVHSYMSVPVNPKDRLADTLYNGQSISAVVKKDNIYGCQFHPEKSGAIGLTIIEQFMKI